MNAKHWIAAAFALALAAVTPAAAQQITGVGASVTTPLLNGNVGIGASDPLVMLNIVSKDTVTGGLHIQNPNGNNFLQLGPGSGLISSYIPSYTGNDLLVGNMGYGSGVRLFAESSSGYVAPSIALYKANGTRTAPTAVTYIGYEQSALGYFSASGWDGATWNDPGSTGGGGMFIYADENWDATHHGSHPSIYATILGHTSAHEVIAFGGKDANGLGDSASIISYEPIAFYGRATPNPEIVANIGPPSFMFTTADAAQTSFVPIYPGNVVSAGFLQSGPTASGGVPPTAATAQAGDLVLAKETDAGTAPGAGFCKIKAVAGTTAGTGKIIAYCGTSTTPVTITDNIGSGF